MKTKLTLLTLAFVLAACSKAPAPTAPSHQPTMGSGERTHVVIVHEVEDGEHWLSAWRGDNSRHTLFEQNGAAHVHTMQDPTNPNLTALVISVTDMDKLNAMLTSDEGVAAGKEDGVKMDTMQFLIQAN